MPDNDELGALWRVLDQLGPILSTGQSRTLVLNLIFIRSQHEERWTAVRSEPNPGLETLLRGLPADELSEVSIPAPSVRAVLDVVDRVVRRVGGDGAFRLLLEEFAAREGSRGADVYTPASITAVLAGVADIRPEMTVYDPFCRWGEILTAFAARVRDEKPNTVLRLFGVTPNTESLAIARMNADLHGRKHDFRLVGASELLLGPPLGEKYSLILANPPFGMADWTSREPRDWPFGPPPLKNANFAWLQHVVERLAPGGLAAVVMPNGASFSTNHHEQHIRGALVEAGCVDALISLPPGLFRNTGIAATVWLLKPPSEAPAEILFIDVAQSGGSRHELSAAQVEQIISGVHGWRRGGSPDEDGAIAVPISRVRAEGYNLSPAIYLMPSAADHGRNYSMATIQGLVRRLEDQHRQAARSDAATAQLLEELMG